jgi:hypothetical protein
MAITERKGPVEWYRYYYGLSTDAKPTGVPIGSVFVETDTGKRFETGDGTIWFLIVA